jgi:hypothetical protein
LILIVIARSASDEASFVVIPEAAARGYPESIATIVSMDSGPAPDGASRNDGGQLWIASLALAMTRSADCPSINDGLRVYQRRHFAYMFLRLLLRCPRGD